MAFGRNLNKISNNSVQSALATLSNQMIPVRVLAVDNTPSLTNGQITGDILTNQATIQDLHRVQRPIGNGQALRDAGQLCWCVRADST